MRDRAWVLSPIDWLFCAADSRPSNVALWFDGPVDHSVLQQALTALGDAVPVIRSTLWLPEAGSAARPALVPLASPLPVSRVRCAAPPGPELELLALIEPVRTVPGEPLVRLCHVAGARRSVLLVSFAHVLGDAAACFELLVALCALASGRQPGRFELDRGVFDGLFAQAPPHPRLPEALGALVQVGLRTEHRAAPVVPGDVVGVQRTVFERATLRAQRVAGEQATGRRVSQFGLMAGHLWAERAQRWVAQGAGEQPVGLACPVDLRRLLPELGPRYFGNALRAAVVRAPAAQVVAAAPHERAARIMDAVAAIDRDSLTLDYQVMNAVYAASGMAAVSQMRIAGHDSVLVSDVSFAPTGVLRLGPRRCERLSFLNLYAHSAAVVPDGAGYAVVRARLAAEVA